MGAGAVEWGRGVSGLFRAYSSSAEIERRFAAFHARHPEVYRLFARLAGEARAAGHRRYSAKTLFEVMRWNFDVPAPGRGPGPSGAAGCAARKVFKLNNSFTSCYARLLIDRDRSFEGFFETRERADGRCGGRSEDAA